MPRLYKKSMFVKYIKFAFLSAVLLAPFIPTVSLAIDQRCWTKSACEKVDANNMPGLFYGPNSETTKACQMTEDMVTGDKVGFCSAAGYAKTEIEFGAGNNQFANFGKFIEWFYQYAIIVASILAIFMIIFSGFQWATSGGSPEKITEARKKIGGAMMGLFLAVLAYFILNIVNPYLVHLRLPQIWRINTSGLTPPYCDQIKDGKKVSESKPGPFKLEPSATVCGKDYFVEGTPDLTCKGRFCESSICVNLKENDKPSCFQGLLGGTIGAPKQFLCDDELAGNIIDDNLKLIAVCSSGDIEEIEELDLDTFSGKNARWYIFGHDASHAAAIKKSIDEYKNGKCSEKDGNKLVGFYLGAEINDEGGGIGGKIPWCNVNILSSGCDDWHAIGKSSVGECDVNLSIEVFEASFKSSPDCALEPEGAVACGCSGISQDKDMKLLTSLPNFTEFLITEEELSKSFTCNIMIDRTNFPALSNGSPLKGVVCENLNPKSDNTSCWYHQSYW